MFTTMFRRRLQRHWIPLLIDMLLYHCFPCKQAACAVMMWQRNGGTPGGTSAAAGGTPSLPFNGGTPSLHRFLRPLFFPFNINVLY